MVPEMRLKQLNTVAIARLICEEGLHDMLLKTSDSVVAHFHLMLVQLHCCWRMGTPFSSVDSDGVENPG